MNIFYECIVIGGGHAGIEAALASSRMGSSTLMVTFAFDRIGQMSCNPAIGGVGKGQLVKEVDALGGQMGKAADATSIQFRQLNSSKGQAVRSSRCQSDCDRYKDYMQSVIGKQSQLEVLEDKVIDIVVKDGRITGIRTQQKKEFRCCCVVIAVGTFLNSRMHRGQEITLAGRVGETNAECLAQSLKDLGFKICLFKTGTPPRLDGKTIDFSTLTAQYSDDHPIPFSFQTSAISPDQKLMPCHITYTNEKTHDIITANMHLSPMYSGQMKATGVRYCPSIEDKLKKFPGKLQHQIFLEPQGLDTDEYYPNGISTGLPIDVQEEFVHSIKGLENVKITEYGYSIEHGVIPPTEITPWMETKSVKGLFFAGQINGTTGYEEAAAQGMMAGINAALNVKNKKPFVLARNEAYIGVLIDDLTTKGTEEPYRMFTSRVEYRLIIREDNADKRLAKYGYQFGLVSKEAYQKVEQKYASIEEKIQYLKTTRVSPGASLNQALKKSNSVPLKQSLLLSDILKRPEVRYEMLADFDEELKSVPKIIRDSVEYEIKYEGFIVRQLKDVEKFRHIENIKIPGDINYENVHGLSIEVRQKLKRFAPLNLGQANRISGITPAAISVLMIYLRGYKVLKKIVSKNK